MSGLRVDDFDGALLRGLSKAVFVDSAAEHLEESRHQNRLKEIEAEAEAGIHKQISDDGKTINITVNIDHVDKLNLIHPFELDKETK